MTALMATGDTRLPLQCLFLPQLPFLLNNRHHHHPHHLVMGSRTDMIVMAGVMIVTDAIVGAGAGIEVGAGAGAGVGIGVGVGMVMITVTTLSIPDSLRTEGTAMIGTISLPGMTSTTLIGIKMTGEVGARAGIGAGIGVEAIIADIIITIATIIVVISLVLQDRGRGQGQGPILSEMKNNTKQNVHENDKKLNFKNSCFLKRFDNLFLNYSHQFPE